MNDITILKVLFGISLILIAYFFLAILYTFKEVFNKFETHSEYINLIIDADTNNRVKVITWEEYQNRRLPRWLDYYTLQHELRLNNITEFKEILYIKKKNINGFLYTQTVKLS